MENLHSYPSIYALGHRAIADILKGPVVVEEKIDGSQFSMARVDGQLLVRSKGKQIVPDAPEKMFSAAVETAKQLDLREGWVYRGEYLQSPSHNTLKYSRVPAQHIILFDVCIGLEDYLTPTAKKQEADRLGLECVPCFFEGEISTLDQLTQYLDRESVLGGCKIEGFVVKNYGMFTLDKKIAIAKFVSEEFKEKHGVEWKKANPGNYDVLQQLIFQLKTEPRWRKAIQHLRDNGSLSDSPKDIGVLLTEIQSDIEKEEKDYILERLWKHFWPHISRGVIAGFPEFYKRTLAENAFTAQL